MTLTTTIKVLVVVGVLAGLAAHPLASDNERLVEAALEEATANPQSIEAWTRLSAAYLRVAVQEGRINETTTAEWAAARAVELDTLNAGALNQLSRVKMQQRRFADIIPLQNRALVGDKRNPDSWGLLGDAYMRMGGYREADSCYFLMYELNAGFGSLVRVAQAGFMLRDFDVSLRYLKRAIEIGPSTGVSGDAIAYAYRELARMQLSRGQWVKALRNVEAAIELVPESVAGWAQKADILLCAGNQRAALEIYENLAGRSPDPLYKARLARVHAEMGRPELADTLVHTALAQYEDIAKLYPEAVAAARIEIMLEWGIDVKEALRMASQLSRKQRDAYTYELLARAYLANGNSDFAWSCIGLALRNGVRDPHIFYTAAVVAKAAGDTDKYRKYAAMVRSINPQYRKIYGSL